MSCNDCTENYRCAKHRTLDDCSRCLRVDEGIERYSCGYYAGRYCDRCWAESGYRDAWDAIDPSYAGEQAEPEPGPPMPDGWDL